jgi:hypothetical protein
MISCAFSGLSQKLGWPILTLRASRCVSLPATSKRVPHLGQTAKHVIGAAAEIGVHRVPRSRENRKGRAGPRKRPEV